LYVPFFIDKQYAFIDKHASTFLSIFDKCQKYFYCCSLHRFHHCHNIIDMKNFFIGLVLGVILTSFTGWYFFVARKSRGVRHAQDSTASALQHAGDVIETRLQAWHLTGDDIQKELTRTGKVVRHQVSDFGTAMADAASDARVTGQVKTKFALDRDLSAWKLSVSTKAGHVMLSGAVANHALIGRAIMLALDTDGVREVTSALQVQQPKH
jgi:gas vesicle protein